MPLRGVFARCNADAAYAIIAFLRWMAAACLADLNGLLILLRQKRPLSSRGQPGMTRVQKPDFLYRL